MNKQFKVGYTQGVYDMFHKGHLNLLLRAKEYCDYLIVGVNADSLVESYKHKLPVINEKDRMFIIENLKCVDRCVVVETLDKVELCKDLKFEAIFIGDDWKGNPRWNQTEVDLRPLGATVVYLPYTDGVSSTLLRTVKDNKIQE